MGLFTALSGAVGGSGSWWDVADQVAPAAFSMLTSNNASNTSQQAASQVAGATESAARAQLAMFDTSREDFQPYRNTGTGALYALAGLNNVEYEGAPGTMKQRADTAMSRFQASPGYQFRLDEGTKALDKSAAARGKLLSGAQLKGVTNYAQNVASSEFGNYQNRLANLAGIGQSATGATANAGAAATGNAGALQVSGASARAGGMVAGASAQNQSLSNLAYLWG